MADLITMLSAAAGAGGEYEISRSLRFNSADSAYLNRTPASAGNRKTWTWSGWVKRSALGASSAALFSANTASGTTGYTALFFQGGVDNFYFETIEGGGGKVVETTAKFRDPSAWYHFVLAVDTSQGTAADRVKMYVNGVQITSFSTQNTITQDFLTSVNDTVSHDIGVARNSGGTRAGYYNGYLTEVNFIDGQALTPSSFGKTNPTTGVWQPIKYAGSYGTNGFYLNFSDNSNTTASTLGKDYSGNGNNWTPNNFSVTAGAGNDSLVDTPTPYGTDTGAGGEVRGNYCTLNPLGTGVPSFSGSVTTTYSNGNLQVALGTGAYFGVTGTFAMPSSGKWYWEVVATVGDASTGISVGASYGGASEVNVRVDGAGIYSNGSSVQTGLSGIITADVIGIGWNADTNSLQFYKNGSTYGNSVSYTPTAGASYFPFAISTSSGNALTVVFNFGQRPFAYTAPSGFKALVTTNLPDPTVVQGDDYFNTVLYDGTGSSQSITTVGFTPDFTWIKEKNAAADHALYDVVRGVQNQLESNTTTAETVESTGLTAFVTGGFTVGALAQVNTSGDNYVAWNWKANGAGSSNTDGTITSTVSANTTAGISIVTYTGTGSAATVGHGLGAAPRMIIVKNRDQADAWQVYHAANTANPETDYLVLNTTAGTADAADRWNDTLPTSTVFSIGNGVEVNTNTEKYVAYCFAEVEGFSKFGSYTGNGSADGPFVYTGFRPAFIMIKNTTTAGRNWLMFDVKRNTYNVVDDALKANASDAEASANWLVDFLSNGFKLRNDATSGGPNTNNSGDNYIYACFASNPFKTSLAQ